METADDYLAEGALVLGGGAALLLQLAHPAIGSAVARHSRFPRDPMRRLRHTLGYVYAIGLGTPEAAAGAARAVDRMHDGIPGARDAELQLWVAATLHGVGMQVHDLLFAPLPDAVADEVYAVSGRFGTSLQVPPELWPATRADFDAYWERMLPTLDVRDDARAVAAAILHPVRGTAPWWVRAALPLGRLVTAGLLPSVIRDAYGLPRRPRRERAASTLIRILARLTPRRIRRLPSRLLLPALR
ncbi:oxygenase MpaB family protein [Homoserinibacter sp. GY 40078]|uniref:oxygenase MpaB family protein n=1 Tax=Homoserinibacter sp. GY 40078 TaxID=2603275 RepID=UPI00165018A7|nr:oxygenase MpaB family protein [Homoserinibacter sp. GY 40078]